MSEEESTGRRRKITASEAEDLIDDVRRDRSAVELKSDFRKVERRLAEVFGADWDGGDFAAMQRQLARHEERLDRMERLQAEHGLFITKIKWTIATWTAIGGAVIAVAVFALEHLLK